MLIAFAILAGLAGLPLLTGLTLPGVLLSLILARILALLAVHVGLLVALFRVLLRLTARRFR